MESRARASKKSLAILTVIFLISNLFIFRDFLFGNQIPAFTDIGSDTYDQYLMHYQTIINHLREGSFSLWDFNNGLGINMYSLNLFDPFLMLLYFCGAVFGADKIYGFLVYLQILRILLAGWAIYCFLSCFSYSERSKILASYLYGVCGYMMVWGQHYQFGTPLVLLPLLLMAAEKSFRRRNWLLGMTLFCAIASIASLYLSYMQFIVLGFYLLFRTAWKGRLFSREGLKIIGRAYGSMILGIGIGLFSLIPSACMIFGVSSRMESGDSLVMRLIQALRPYGMEYYKTFFKRLFSSVFQGVNVYTGYSVFYEDCNLFLSGLFLIAAVQFLFFFFYRKYTIKQRMLLIFAAALLGVTLLLPIGGLVFNGFAYEFSRHTFVCMPVFVWLMADVLHDMMENKRSCLPLLILSEVVIVVQYLRVYSGGANLHALHLGFWAVLMAVSLTAGTCSHSRKISRIAVGGLALSLVATMSLDGYHVYASERTTLTKAPSEYFDELYDSDVSDALAYLAEEDTSFYRVEKDYTVGTTTSCLNSLAQNYAGVTTYNSTLNKNTQDYFRILWPNMEITDRAHYSFANGVNDDFQASLTHVKYVLSQKGDFHVQGYELYGQFGDTYVYRNTHTQDFGKFYQSVVTTETYETSGEWNEEALLSENVLCDSIPQLVQKDENLSGYRSLSVLTGEDVTIKKSDEHTLNLSFPELPLNEEEKYVMEFDMTLPETAYEITVTAGSHATRKVVGPEPVQVVISVPGDVHEVTISHYDENVISQLSIANIRIYRQDVKDLTGLSDGIYFEMEKKDSRVSGRADVTDEGVLLLPIPWEEGWHAYVDEKETEIHKVDYGLSGILLESGNHEVEMVYRCPGFLPGVAGSGVFLAITALLWGILFFRKKNGDLRLQDYE